MKLRQDAWTEENDLLLAETVLRHVREGSTQLNAFEEVGDVLERTSAACGFRWNAVVRYNYEKALQLAKKFRKEKLRHAKGEDAKKKLLYTPSESSYIQTDVSSNLDRYLNDEQDLEYGVELDQEFGSFVETDNENDVSVEVRHIEEPTTEIYSSIPSVQNQYQSQTQTPPASPMNTRKSSITMFDVIQFLQGLSSSQIGSDRLVRENDQLKRELMQLQERNSQLQRQVEKLEKDATTVQEDYETMMKIMNRARKLVLFEEEEKPAATSFRMDKNGNLEKIAE
ncbi:RsfA family transcriptional regulator [Gottfriedia acidiceleris]|uniref:RsfA family transcriptional regulator n=1 Tax=Gottfriedia acidiceleris TaxID=371036 RepID=A0ABY4JSV7_9BACI|nr:RsfA family transcriptional regulator [Gottfriedia acidiceleris]UPM56572.1 RsfA family transcriptional regulator [Gottfriedia acidiceleris]